ncbi:relaxase/mobilization nuclease domain-containing protein [Leucobacter massiliensis]|nr:relaxase/mobilization nuclease domain-containing protein [Leucobacter massiliensis]
MVRGTAHDGSGEPRAVYVGGVGGIIPAVAPGQFAAIRRRFGNEGAKRQGIMGYISFSREELDPDDPDAGLKALRIGQRLVNKQYPGHPALLAVQRDGVGGLWHVHFLVSAVSDRDAVHIYRRKPRKGEQPEPDGLIEQQDARAAGRAVSSAMTNAWRLQHTVDSVLADEEFMQSIGLTAYDNEALMEERRVGMADRATAAELEDQHAGNDWRAHLRAVVADAQAEATSLDEYRDLLSARGIELKTRKSKTGTDFGDGVPVNFSYRLTDALGKQRNARAGGRDGIGDELGSAATLARIEQNIAPQPQPQPQPQSLPAPTPALQQAAPSFSSGLAGLRRQRDEEEHEAQTVERVAAYESPSEAVEAPEVSTAPPKATKAVSGPPVKPRRRPAPFVVETDRERLAREMREERQQPRPQTPAEQYGFGE